MGAEHLTPFNKRPKGEVRLIGQKGGQSKSVDKSIGAKWRHIKERLKRQGLTNDDVAWMMQRLSDRDTISVDILMYLDEIKKDVHPSQRIALANALKDVAKFQHGEKIKTENLNVNVNVSIEDWEKRLYGDD